MPDDHPGFAPARRPGRLGFLLLLAGVGLTAEVGSDPARLAASDPRVPVRKDFTPDWIASLTARGESTVVRSNHPGFAFIGMPVGGIGAGEVYLAGDGRLWDWDIFNNRLTDGFQMEQGSAYRQPLKAGDPADSRQEVLAQGFALRIGGALRPLDASGFTEVAFCGEYPIGRVVFADPACPLRVSLEAFSPFVPGSVDDSSWPATVMEWTLDNPGDQPVACEFGGWLENGVGRATRNRTPITLEGTVSAVAGGGILAWSASETPGARAPRVVADFESGTYDGWTVEGTAFGTRPHRPGEVTFDRGDPVRPVRIAGSFYLDSFDNQAHDGATGRLTSAPFVIDRHFLTFRVGGGAHLDVQGLQLLIDGKPVRSAAGRFTDQLRLDYWDVREFAGRSAQIRVLDDVEKGGWGHTLADDFILADTPYPVAAATDMGSMALMLLGDGVSGAADLTGARPAEDLFAAPAAATASSGGRRQVGGLRRSLAVPARGSVRVTALIAWHLPNPLPIQLASPTGRRHGARFFSASDVAAKLAADLPRLAAATRAWHETWYGSSLPRWFLDRTFANVSILATSTCYLLADGRFYANEGRYSCPGTCTHVWGYQQATGFLFPELECSLREQAEFVPGRSLSPDGGIAYRGTDGNGQPAVDGQAEILLRTLLAHRMSPNDAFVRRVFPAVRQATDWLIAQRDADRDGILTGAQDNTLDAAWFCRNAWLSLLYQAGLRASAEMAGRVGEGAYAADLRRIADAGRRMVEEALFNGEYFADIPDPTRLDSAGPYGGCHIDQLMGQGWAWQAGLGTIVDPAKAAGALDAIWKANVTTDVAPYRARPEFAKGRRFAMDGEGGTLMGTFPRGFDERARQGYGEYFNEVWSGSEHFLAGTLMWQGETLRALAVERLVHDRYSLPRRNPWNECECGSHYSRALASYGVFTAACGFAYDGPAGILGFAPRLSPQDFKAAFTAAEGWGSFSQKQEGAVFTAMVALRHGRLRLATLRLQPPSASAVAVRAEVDGRPVVAEGRIEAGVLAVRFPVALLLQAGQSLTVELLPAR